MLKKINVDSSHYNLRRLSVGSVFCLITLSAFGDEVVPTEQIEIVGKRVNLVGEAISASEGRISQQDLATRPILRTGEILESVPGMVATQHSGSGKANQYFLRGFNLDHGTDFNTSIDRMPINMRSHGHGQGYTDLNFIIPELVNEIIYRKGSYYADVADFSGAGSANIKTKAGNMPTTVKIGMGQDSFTRSLIMGTLPLASATQSESSRLLYAAEYQTYDGPWQHIEEDVKKKNLWLKHLWQMGSGALATTLMAYDNRWNSADQIPARAVEQGTITELGSIDPTVGGDSSRYSLSFNWNNVTNGAGLDATFYAIQYELDLFSNFSYYTADDGNGDQFRQIDDRMIYGWDLSWQWSGSLAGRAVQNTVGTQSRYDDIDKVGLLRTQNHNPVPGGDIRLDAVKQWSLGIYWQSVVQWTEAFRSVLGVRYDFFDFEVDGLAAEAPDSIAANSGSADDNIVSPSLSFIYSITPAYET